MKNKQWKPYQGILFFILVMAAFFVIMVPLQIKFGMYGLAMTEAILLVMAIGYTKVCGGNMREVFPIGPVRAAPVFGIFLLWIATFAVVMVLTLGIAYFFPEEVLSVGSGLSDTISSVPFLLGFLFTVIMPAICEEAVHRGVILHSMLPLKRKWLIVLIMGLLFGLFHTNIWRFVPTAILGGAISYVMLETRNIVYPAIFHGINNFVPLVMSSMAAKILQTAGEEASQVTINFIPVASIGIYVMMATCVPFAAYAGNYLLHYQAQGYRKTFFPEKHQSLIITLLIVSSVLILALGGILFLYGIFFDSGFQDMMRQNMQNAI